MARWGFIALFGCVALVSAGCAPGASDGASGSTGRGEDAIQFNDSATTNAQPGDVLANLEFVDQAGKTIRPRDFAGKKSLVLVFTRGYNGSICPYCSAYTSGLIANYSAIAQRGAEVVVVYPVARKEQSGRLSEFLEATFKRSEGAASRTPFPVVLDLELKGVTALGIRKDLSKPATYLLDKKGRVRFAYVGNSLADRPSIKVILSQLDSLKQERAEDPG